MDRRPCCSLHQSALPLLLTGSFSVSLRFGEDIMQRFHFVPALKAEHAHVLGEAIG
jgi:hypothetical protein